MIKKLICFLYGHELQDNKRRTVYYNKMSPAGYILYSKRVEQAKCMRCEEYKEPKC